MPPASESLMPDAVIELQDCFLFLEMDMGTEFTNRLEQKWNSYRSFLNYPSDFYRKKPVIVLFILEGIKRPEARSNIITAGLFRHIGDRINGNFEVYVNVPEALHEVIKTRLFHLESKQNAPIYSDLRKNHSFLLSRFQEFVYIRKLNAEGKVLAIGGKLQEFLFDIWLDGRLSMLQNILYFNRISAKIRSSAGRALAYVVVVPSEKWIHNILKSVKLIQPPNIYFTTPTRLSGERWPEALFVIDQLNNLLHYKDDSLQETVYERRLN